MAENGNRGSNDFRSRNVRRRREPPIIDASATEVPLDTARSVSDEIAADAAPLPSPAEKAVSTEPPPSDTAEPVLFGSAIRDSAPKGETVPKSGLVDTSEPAATNEPASDSVSTETGPLHLTALSDATRDGATERVEPPAHDPVPTEPVIPAASPEEPASASHGPAGPPPYRPASSPMTGGGGLLPWLLSLAIFALLGTLAWVLYTEPQRSGRDEIADLSRKVAALEARPDPSQVQGSVAALDKRTAAADADRAGLSKSVADLKTRLDDVAQQAQTAKATADKVAATPAAQPAPAEAAKPDTSAPAFASLAAVAALAAKLDGVDGRVTALSDDETRTAKTVADLPKPVAPDFGAVDAKLGALDARLTALGGTVNGADARFNDFDAKVNGVDGKINGFDARMNGIDVRMNGIESKANDVASRADKLQSTVADLPKVDLAPLQASTTALDTKVDAIAGQLSAAKDGARVTEARAVGSADEAKATPIALVGQAITRAIAEGHPYGSDLDALKSLGAEPGAIAKLSPLAATGAPTTGALQARWEAVQGDVLAAVKPTEAGSALDRFAASARALVQVRRVGAIRGDDPAAIVSQIDAALGAGDVPASLAAWEKLPQAGRDASQDWAAAARSAVEASGAARDLVGHAIATLGRTKS